MAGKETAPEQLPPRLVEICADPAARVALVVSEIAREAIARKGSFSIAIAGGSLVKMLGAMAGEPGVQWEHWHVAWVDERCVSHDHAESNYGGAKQAWLSKVAIPESQIYAINESLCGGSTDGEAQRGAMAEAAAEDYEKKLRAVPEACLTRSSDGMPCFDLLLLGFGPDGHICSLFPGHALLDDTSGRWVLPISDSPKPPPERITLSMSAVKVASRVLLVGTGDGKKEIVEKALAPESQLPCSIARAADGNVTWILDAAAAALLPKEPNSMEFIVAHQ